MTVMPDISLQDRVVVCLLAAGLTLDAVKLVISAPGIRITVAQELAQPAAWHRPAVRVGEAHSLTLRDGRLILDGHYVTDERLVGVAS